MVRYSKSVSRPQLRLQVRLKLLLNIRLCMLPRYSLSLTKDIVAILYCIFRSLPCKCNLFNVTKSMNSVYPFLRFSISSVFLQHCPIISVSLLRILSISSLPLCAKKITVWSAYLITFEKKRFSARLLNINKRTQV